jgi:hypothetical protein
VELRDDPAEVLALVVDPLDLWSIAEAITADAALACVPDSLDDDAYTVAWNGVIELVVSRSWSERHERRLSRLVQRVHGQLTFVESAAARDLLTEARAAFEREENVRRKLAGLLLTDSVDELPPAETFDALAA